MEFLSKWSSSLSASMVQLRVRPRCHDVCLGSGPGRHPIRCCLDSPFASAFADETRKRHGEDAQSLAHALGRPGARRARQARLLTLKHGPSPRTAGSIRPIGARLLCLINNDRDQGSLIMKTRGGGGQQEKAEAEAQALRQKAERESSNGRACTGLRIVAARDLAPTDCYGTSSRSKILYLTEYLA